MNGLSLLSTIISVLSFPLAFLALLYPHVASPKGRWRGFFFYVSLSGITLLLAALTAKNPSLTEAAWSPLDWTVFLLGGGLFLAFLTRKRWKNGFAFTRTRNGAAEGRLGSNHKKKLGIGKNERGEGKGK